ncbi:glycosyltransferase [Acinetobacter sp. WU_MDCI_Axc73]|nr:glycosyltransferase [Acinetobacter sp. WU_MDCI_Axc73]
MNCPLVTFVVPCYNHEDFVEKTLMSVFNQSYKNIELIVIDDGSTDSSVEKIKQNIVLYKKRFSRFEFIARENRGLCKTLNEGINWAKGDLICFLASDDIIFENKIEVQLKYIEKYPDVTSFYSGIKLINASDEVISTHETPLQFYNFDDIILHNFVLYAPTAIHKLSDLKEIGGFDNSVKIEDWDLWLKLKSHNKKIVTIPEILAFYRSHNENMSKKNDFMCKELLFILEKYKTNKNFSKAKFNIIKQYKLKPLKHINPFKYYLYKTIFYFQSKIK